MVTNSELRELGRELGSDEGLIQKAKENVEPIREKIKEHPEELICSLERFYENCLFDSDHNEYDSGQKIQVGLITPETDFPNFSNKGKNLHTLLTGVRMPCFRYGRMEDFESRPANDKFYNADFSPSIATLALMNSSPKMPGDASWGIDGFGDRSIPPYEYFAEMGLPRLEFYVGNSESIPLLEKELKGWEYSLLREYLGRENLPISQNMEGRIVEEQRRLTLATSDSEKVYEKLKKEKENRVEGARKKHNPNLDEGFWNLHFSGSIAEARENYERNIKEGLKRMYDQSDTWLNGSMEGVSRGEYFHVGEFFSKRKGDLKKE